MDVSNRPKKLSLSSLYASTSSAPDTPSTLGNESVVDRAASTGIRESFGGKTPGISRTTVEESLGGNDMMSARTLLKTSLSEKMELRQSMKALQEEVDFLRSTGGSARGRSPTMSSIRGRSPMMASPRVGFSDTGRSMAGSSSLFRVASGGIAEQSSGEVGTVISEYKVSVKQFKRQKHLYFRAVVYSVVLKQLRRGFRTWRAWLCGLRRHISRLTRHQVTTRLLDSDSRHLREMVFLRWKYSLQTLQKYDVRTYEAIRVYLTRRRKWRCWTKWMCCCARRQQIKRSICRRFRLARLMKTRETFRRWRYHSRRLAVVALATRARFDTSVVSVKLLFRFNYRRRIRACWVKWKLTGQVMNLSQLMEQRVLCRCARVCFRKLSSVSKAFAHWRHVAFIVMPKIQTKLANAVRICVSRVFTHPVYGSFLRWRRLIAEERLLRRMDMVSAASASVARQAALARRSITDASDRRQYLYYIRAPFLGVVARHISRGSLPTAFAWWRVFTVQEVHMHALRTRVKARLTSVVERTAVGRMQRGFNEWVAEVRRQVQIEIEGKLDEHGLNAEEKHAQYVALLEQHRHHQEHSEREKLEHQALMRNTEDQLLRMKRMLGKLTIRRVFMRRLADAMKIWSHNITLMRMLQHSHHMGHERLHCSNRKNAAKFFVRLRSELQATDVKLRVTRAFLLWCSSVRMLDRRHRLARKTMNRMLFRKTAYAFEKWREFVGEYHRRMLATVASTSLLKRVGRRMVKVHMHRALRVWKLGAVAVAASRGKLRALIRICGKLSLRGGFRKLREAAFSHYICTLRGHVGATQVLLEDSIFDHRLDLRLAGRKLMFRLWKQYTRGARTGRGSHGRTLTLTVSASAVKGAWVAWRRVWGIRRRLRNQLHRRTRAFKALYLSHWKTVTMTRMQLQSEVIAETMNVSVGAVRASADRLSKDNAALVRKLKTNVALVQKLMGDMRGIIQIQDHNKLVRKVYLAWKRIASENYQHRRSVGLMMSRHALTNRCSGVVVAAAWERWRMLFSIRKHRRASALYMRRCCFNSWKLLHYYSRLQRYSVARTDDQGSRTRMFEAFCSWKFGVYAARKRQFQWIDRLMDPRGRNVGMLFRLQQRRLRFTWDQWRHFIAVRREVMVLVRRKVTLVKSVLFQRWRRVARNRRRIRRAVTTMTHRLRYQRGTTLHRDLSRAWRRWHEYLSLRVRSAVLATWEQCRGTQKDIATRQFTRLLAAAVRTSRAYLVRDAWMRWGGRVRRQTTISSLLLQRCVSLRCHFAFTSSVFNSPGVAQSALLRRRFRLAVLRRAVAQWRVVGLEGAHVEIDTTLRAKLLGRLAVLVGARCLRVGLGRWRRATVHIRMHRSALVTSQDEREKTLKLAHHFGDAYGQLVKSRVLACLEEFLRDCGSLERVIGTDGLSARGVACAGADAQAPSTGPLGELTSRLREQVIRGIFEKQLGAVLCGKFAVRVVLTDTDTGQQRNSGDLSYSTATATPAGTDRLYARSKVTGSELDERPPFSPAGVGAAPSPAVTVTLPAHTGSREPVPLIDRDRETEVHVQRCLRSRVWHAVVVRSGTDAPGAGLQMAFVPVLHHDKRTGHVVAVAVVEVVRRVDCRYDSPELGLSRRSRSRVGYVAAESIITGETSPTADFGFTPFTEAGPSMAGLFADAYSGDAIAQLLSVAALLHPSTNDILDHGERDHAASAYFVHQFVSLFTCLGDAVVHVLGLGPDGGAVAGVQLLCRHYRDLLLRSNDNCGAHETEREKLGANIRFQEEGTAKLRHIIAGSGHTQQKLTAKLSEAAEKYRSARTRAKELEGQLSALQTECEAERERSAELSCSVNELETLARSRAQSGRQWGDLLGVLRSTACTPPPSVYPASQGSKEDTEVDSDPATSPAARNAAIAALNNSPSSGKMHSFRGSPGSVKQFRRQRLPREGPDALHIGDL